MIYVRLIRVFLRLGLLHEVQYRAHFFMQVFQSALQLGTALAGLAVVFAHTETVRGWRPAELLAHLGVYILIGGMINLVIQPSMQQLMRDVHQGTLDFALLRPVDSQALVSMRQTHMWRLVDVLLGLGVVLVATARLGGDVGAHQAFLFVVALLAGGAIVYSFWLILATCSFWLVRVDNIFVIFQDMYEAGRWPVGSTPSGSASR